MNTRVKSTIEAVGYALMGVLLGVIIAIQIRQALYPLSVSIDNPPAKVAYTEKNSYFDHQWFTAETESFDGISDDTCGCPFCCAV